MHIALRLSLCRACAVTVCIHVFACFFFFQAEDGIRDLVRSRGLGDVYKRQDVKNEPNISGDLSHKYKLPKHAQFVGVLTRFRNPEIQPAIKYDVLAIISGPEPQRTIFEDLIIDQAKNTNKKYVIVSGISEKNTDIQFNDNIRMISHIPGEELFQLILCSEIIISRGGYSTLMDLAVLNKKCIFVPTPGQTEQEYLVEELHNKKMIYGVDQGQFKLQTALDEVEKTKGFYVGVDVKEFEGVLRDTINRI